MLELTLPWWEFLVRGSVIYLTLLLLLRLGGKRQVGQLTSFDLVLLLIISNAVQNAMVGPDTSLIGGLLVVLTLMVWNRGLSWLTSRSRKIERLLEGRPEILVHRGHVYEDVLQRQQLSYDDLKAALRRAGCFEIKDAEFAILEINGAITVKHAQSTAALL